jgi:hypothetical protein
MNIKIEFPAKILEMNKRTFDIILATTKSFGIGLESILSKL